jgi:hypothetical protein
MSTTKILPDPDKKTGRTTIRLPEVRQSAKRVSQNAVLRLFHHLSGPTNTASARPSESQRQLVVTGFILGVVSILTFIFPVCSLPASICGLLIGIYGRRKSRALHTMATWAIVLSLIGLILSLLYIIITMAVYAHRHLTS